MIRKALLEDLTSIFEIRIEASKRMKAMGIDQWQDSQPTLEMFISDIEKGIAYVFERNQKIVGIATFQTDPENTYETLVDLKIPALTCHRLAVSNEALRQGIAKQLLSYMEKYAKMQNIHILYVDTHPDNIPMQQILKNFGMKPLGNIMLMHLRSKKRTLFMKTLTF